MLPWTSKREEFFLGHDLVPEEEDQRHLLADQSPVVVDHSRDAVAVAAVQSRDAEGAAIGPAVEAWAAEEVVEDELLAVEDVQVAWHSIPVVVVPAVAVDAAAVVVCAYPMPPGEAKAEGVVVQEDGPTLQAPAGE